MSVRHDPLIAHALAREITARWKGASITALRMDRGRRAIELAFEDGSRLVALLHPLHGYVFGVEAEAPPLDLGGKALRVGRLSLAGAEAPPDERALLLTFGDRTGRPWEALALELQTQRWNAIHLSRSESAEDGDASNADEDPESMERLAWRIEAVMLSRDAGDRPLRRGVDYRLPESTRSGIGAPPPADEWAAAVDAVPEDERRRALLQTWAWSSTLNVDWILAAGAAQAYDRYLGVRSVLDGLGGASAGWVHERRVGPQPYPHPLGEGTPAAGGLLDAMAGLVEARGGVRTLLDALPDTDESGAGDEAGQLEKKLRARRKRVAKRQAALERQLAAAAPPEDARTTGQLILARKSEIPKGASRVTLEDFEGEPREVTLDPRKDAVANAESFFDEARRAERALERLPAEIAEAGHRLERLDDALLRLETSGPSDALWEAVGGRPLPSKRGAAKAPLETRLPYSRLVSSGGLEIRVGRGAQDNDDLTFRHSAPDDIWLHASQSSGAHVILRWGRKDENPPGRDLLEAATAAAINSGARHSGTVPVVWTRRKYVRKPRKSPPGTVLPSHVATLFVKPDERLLKSLRDRADSPMI